VLDKINFQTPTCIRILDHIQILWVTVSNVTHISDHASNIGKIRNRNGRVLLIEHMFRGQEVNSPINIIALPDDHVVLEDAGVDAVANIFLNI
jgi:hypothetical protein